MKRLGWCVLVVALASCRFTLDRELETGEIRGRLVLAEADGTQQAAAGAWVRVEKSAVAVRSDALGRFRLRGLPPGRVTLAITHDADGDGASDNGLRIANVANDELAGRGSDLGTMTLGRLGAIDATVVRGTTLVPGAVVALDGLRGATADDTGRVHFGSLLPTWGGAGYTVAAFVEDGEGARGALAQVVVAPGETKQLQLAIDPALLRAGSVHGRVRLAGDAAVEGTTVALVKGDADPISTDAQPQGDFTNGSVPPGVYTLQAERAGYLPLTVPFVVIAGESTEVGELVLAKAATDCGLGAASDIDTDADGIGDACDACPTVKGDRCEANPADQQPPGVVEQVPSPGAVNVPIDTAIAIHFSEPIDPASATVDTVRLLDPAEEPVPAEIKAESDVVTLTPLAPLQEATTYSVVLTTGLTDVAGNHFAAESRWDFTTVDLTAPSVISHEPSGSTRVAVDAVISLQFDEPVDPASVHLRVRPFDTAADVAGELDVQGAAVRFTPAAPLAFDTTYEVQLLQARDLAGNVLAQGLIWSFTTAAATCGPCPEPQTCGGGGVPGQCGCSDSAPEICARNSSLCGVVDVVDRCGAPRTVDCGVCPETPDGGRPDGGQPLDGGLVDHEGPDAGVPACTPVTDAEFCQRMNADCGNVTGTDNCGAPRSAFCSSGASGGTGCWYPEVCGGAGVDNQCGVRVRAVPEWPLPVGETVNALHAAGPGDVWAVANGGWILRHDGSGWAPSPNETALSLLGVWQVAADDVWAVGEMGRLLHFDGTAWSRVLGPVKTTKLTTVWGASANDVWAAGETGVLLHWDGTLWRQVAVGEAANFLSLRGASASDVEAITDAGTAWHWNGTAWAPDVLPAPLRKLWVAPDGSMWGTAGTSGVYRRSGGAWSAVGTAPAQYFASNIWGTSSSDVWITGGDSRSGAPALQHWDGTSWSRHQAPLARVAGLDLGGLSGSDMWVVGESGLVSHFDGASWSASPAPSVVQSIWSDPATGEAIAVGGKGLVLRRSGGAWTQIDVGITDDLYSVAPLGDGRFLLGGDSNTVAIFDGSTASLLPGGAMGRPRSFLVGGPFNLVALGESGVAQRWNGQVWTTLSPAPANGESAFGWGTPTNAWLVSQNGRIRSWDGSVAVQLYSNPSAPFLAIWGSAPNDLWATGYLTFHYDGTQWSPVGMPATSNASGYAPSMMLAGGGNGGSDVWISSSASLYHRVNGGWQWGWAGLGNSDPVRAIAGVGNGQVVVGGGYTNSGRILRVLP